MVLKKGKKRHYSKQHQQISTKIHIPDDSVLTDPEISSKIRNSSYIVFFNIQNVGITPYIQN
jgi:hypothetical protein